MRKYWLKLNKEFRFENGKLRISFSTDNPVYGKRFCVYIEDILVYDGSGRYSKEFEVDSINGETAYKDGRKIELKKVRYIKFK